MNLSDISVARTNLQLGPLLKRPVQVSYSLIVSCPPPTVGVTRRLVSIVENVGLWGPEQGTGVYPLQNAVASQQAWANLRLAWAVRTPDLNSGPQAKQRRLVS